MKQRVWKYALPTGESISLDMPRGAVALDVQLQGDAGPQLWALVDPEEPLLRREFVLAGTGNPIPEHRPLSHVGTFQIQGFVFHLFEVLPEVS